MGEEMHVAQFSANNIMGMKFETTTRYSNLEPVGIGVSGLVCSAKDVFTRKSVAVKKLADPFQSSSIAKHMFREVKLLKHLQHDNVIHLTDIFISPAEDVYLVTDRLAVDLHTIIKTKTLEDQFTQYFMYQIMRGLKYVHSAGVIHRDLKPGNILVNDNCDLQICDFGLARTQKAQMTGYVVTRYYRAPEVMLNWREYDEKVDIWSAACIFAEMMISRPLFPGKNHIHQFSVITHLLGMPSDEVISEIKSENTLNFVLSLPKQNRKPLSYFFPKASHKALSLLDSMLEYNPKSRPSADEVLSSSYLSPYHDSADEPTAPEKFDWTFLEANYPVDVWKSLMYSETLDFHKGNVDGESHDGKGVSSKIASWLESMDVDRSPGGQEEKGESPKVN